MSLSLKLVSILLTHDDLVSIFPFVIMLLIIQGIHPEILIELISYVHLEREQYNSILAASLQLRLYDSLLLSVNGYAGSSYQQKRSIYTRYPHNMISKLFRIFQQEVCLTMLKQCGWGGKLPPLLIVQDFVSTLVDVRVQSRFFPFKEILYATQSELHLVRTTIQMQCMIVNVREIYGEIISFLRENDSALNNIIIVWKNQLNIDSSSSIVLSPQSKASNMKIMNMMFIVFILSVIDSSFIDQRLAEIIQCCGRNVQFRQFFPKHRDFLIKQISQVYDEMKDEVEDLINQSDILELIKTFSSMQFSGFQNGPRKGKFELSPWSMCFGHIRYSNEVNFNYAIYEVSMGSKIFDVFSTFWDVFFQNFSLTFDLSFRPIGNILWSEGYTTKLLMKLYSIIYSALSNFALKEGSKNVHVFLEMQNAGGILHPITAESYRTLFIYSPRSLLSYFLRDFWLTHRKPNPNMSDFDYIMWFFSIPAYASIGSSGNRLLNALRNGTSLPLVQGVLTPNFSYLSYPSQIDPELLKIYDPYFRNDNREIEISSYEGPIVVLTGNADDDE